MTGEVHRSGRIGWLRAGVLGANDRLISTSSLIVGVAAAQPSRSAVLIAAVAGLVAGALSMAAGEYVSVSSQADTELADLAQERGELALAPEAERDELAGIYMSRGLQRDLAIQVAGLSPLYVDVDAIPAAELEAKKAELLRDDSVQKKPENIREQIVEGQLKKWYSQVCLLDQPFRDEERSVRDLITEKIATIGENIRVRRFARYALGEDL